MTMAKKDKNKDKNSLLLSDLATVSCVFGPLLFIIIGGYIWKNGVFDGTIMEQLFPAIFIGFLVALGTTIILSNIFKNTTIIWKIGAIVSFIITIIIYMF